MLRKRIKKKKPLKLFTKQKLHSKSTYFYKQRWFLYSIPLASTLALLLVMGFSINPLVSGGKEVYAAINEDLGNGSTISMAIMNKGLEVANEGIVSTDVEAGQVSYIDNTIKVSTNKIGKYYIGVQAANNSSKLTGATHNAQINEVGTNVKPENFGDNTWGYVLTDNTTAANEDLVYNTLPAYSASTTPQYASTNDPANGDHELKLTFAAKIRADKPADHYQTIALVSVAAEAKKITLENITYMQDINTNICSDTTEADVNGNYQYQLIDKRDNKTYWVAKLKDGRCWMTQNLDLDLNTNTALSSTLSDVTSWTPPVSTQKTTISKFPSTDDYPNFSYDPGNYVYTTPTTQNTCGSTSSKKTQLNGCPNWKAITPTTGDRQTHYLAGNYYSYHVAVAGAKPGFNSKANTSICPSGWTLASTEEWLSNDDSLLSRYGVQKTLTGTIDGITYDIRQAPLYFLYAGAVIDDSLVSAGSSADYWSASNWHDTMANSVGASNNVSSGLGYSRYGKSVRCVAR